MFELPGSRIESGMTTKNWPKIFEKFLAVIKTTATDLKIAFIYLDSYSHC
jgi:hypothetical protein